MSFFVPWSRFVISFDITSSPPAGILCHGLIQEQGFSDGLDFRDRAFQVEGFAEDDLEDLLHVDAVACAAENEAGAHGFGEAAGLGDEC